MTRLRVTPSRNVPLAPACGRRRRAPESVGVGELGDVAEHVAHEAIVEAARFGLDQGARAVGIEAPALASTGAHSAVGRRKGESVMVVPTGCGIGAS